MTSELRPAVEVWREAEAEAIEYNGRLVDSDYAAAAVIEADREAVRAEQAADLAKFKALAETLAGVLEKIGLGFTIELDDEDGPVNVWMDAEELEATERDCTERNYAKPLMELQAEYEAFRREVSDAVEEAIDAIFAASAKQRASDVLSRFIMPKPDPLQDALDATGWAHDVKQTGMADQLRAALAARGLKIVEAE